MASTLPVIDPCCITTCTGTTLVQVPGPKGDAGEGIKGDAGASGKNAYTTLTSPFTMPAEGANGQAAVVNTGWMVVGEVVVMQGAGSFQVISVDSPLLVTLKNLANVVGGMYIGNAAPATVIAATARVAPGGAQGPSGAAFSGVDESDALTPPADPTRGALRYPVGGGPLIQWITASQSWAT